MTKPNLFISLDGENWQPAPQGVRIQFVCEVPGEDALGEICFNYSDEGVITDLWVEREELDTKFGHNIATRCQDYADIISSMIEHDS